MSVKPIPEGYRSVTPLLSVKDAAKLIDFLKKAFGAVEVSRLSAPNGGIMHAELRIGDSLLMLGEACDEFGPLTTALYVYVPDVDAIYRAALEAGAESLEGPTDRFWGDRTGLVRDFAGNKWWIATHVEDVDSEEIARRAQAAMAA